MSEGTGSKPWDADMEYNNLRIAHDQLFDKVIALRAENTRLRGILRDLAGCEDQDLIKGHVVMSTLEVDALRAEVERLRSSIADHENDCACLPEDLSVTETVISSACCQGYRCVEVGGFVEVEAARTGENKEQA